jgi:hypothetical protein
MGKTPSASAVARSQATLAKKNVPPPQHQNVTFAELIQDNLQSASTQKAYASAVSGGQKWLKEKVEEYTTGKGDLRACLTPIFCHPLALVSFDKPTEVTVPLLAEYITHRATAAPSTVKKVSPSTVKGVSPSMVGVIHAAFKRKFLSQYAMLLLLLYFFF